jgi:hypothetical protein
MGEPIYKVLDCQRKGILGLPSGAVHVWLAYWMHESEDNESYISTRALAAITNMDRNTVMKWQRYLLANGWLKLTGGSAADKYDNPTRGASKVLAMRVDDPLKGCLAEKINHEEGGGNIQPEGGGSLIGGKIQPKVSGSGSVSGSRCVTVPTTTPTVAMVEVCSLRSKDEEQNQEQNQKPNQNQNPSAVKPQLKQQLKQLPNYDSPFPAEFDAWSVQARAEWVDLHSVKATVQDPVTPEKNNPLPVEPKPLSSAPVKAAALVAQPPKTPPPPASAPAAPGEEDWRLGWLKRLAKEIYVLQTRFNVNPPTESQTAWLPDIDTLVKLAEGKGSMDGWMLDDVIALSQVRYATKYPTPAAIFADVLALGREVAELRTEGTFTEVRDAYYEVVCPPEQQSDEDELDGKPTMWIDPEVKAEWERKELAKLIMRWNTWLDAHTPQQKMA